MGSQDQVLDSRHADFTQSFINASLQRGFSLVGCEIHYNHYGDRGVVDVILNRRGSEEGQMDWEICELKPRLSNIGEAIRQVRRAQRYFRESRKDLFEEDLQHKLAFLLVLEATDHNLKQYRNHPGLFQGIEVRFHHEDPNQCRQIESLKAIHEAVREAQLGG